MKLVDAEVSLQDEGAKDIVRAPRPARRRVYTSLLVTLSVLIGTVVIIYTIFPNRQDEIMTAAITAHLDEGPAALEAPSGTEIRTWSLSLFGQPAPWPEADNGLVPQSASVIRIFKKNLAVVRYSLNGEKVSVAMWRSRNPAPTVHRRNEDGLHSISWTSKRFTRVAIGPATSKEAWTKHLKTP